MAEGRNNCWICKGLGRSFIFSALLAPLNMKKFLPIASLLVSLSMSAQTVLYTEDFESNPNTFDLNTADVGSTIGGANQWVVNDVYNGGSGDIVCLGIPINFTVPNTAGQPGGISNANGNYLHTLSTEGQADGVLNCYFQAADGFCTTPGNIFSAMNTDVSTMGFADVSLDFWWLCAGGPNIYGEVYYSIDGGSSWQLVNVPLAQYNNTSSWTQASSSMPAFGNQATLRFGFRFVNATSLTASDPGFGIDDVVITAMNTVANEISTDAINALEFCPSDLVEVDYTALGTYNPGNVFTAELSDANGSFASPTVVGTLASTTSGTIAGILPPGTTPGNGYHIRVISSNPPTTGTANVDDITVNAAPNAGVDSSVEYCNNGNAYSLFDELGGSPEPGGSWMGPGGAHNGLFDTSSDVDGSYTYTVTGVGNCAAASATVTVSLVQAADAGTPGNGNICEDSSPVPLFGLLNGTPQPNGSWLDPSGLPFSGIFDPNNHADGEYSYIVEGTQPCPNDTTVIMVEVKPAPNAGVGGTFTICNTDPALELFDLLTGGAELGGTWTDPDGNSFNGHVDPSTFPSGLYTYLIDGGACPESSAQVALIIEDCTSIEENADWSLGIGPNPLANELVIRSDRRLELLQLFNATGRLVHTQELAGQFNLRLPLNLPDGTYILQLQAEGIVHAERIVLVN